MPVRCCTVLFCSRAGRTRGAHNGIAPVRAAGTGKAFIVLHGAFCECVCECVCYACRVLVRHTSCADAKPIQSKAHIRTILVCYRYSICENVCCLNMCLCQCMYINVCVCVHVLRVVATIRNRLAQKVSERNENEMNAPRCGDCTLVRSFAWSLWRGARFCDVCVMCIVRAPVAQYEIYTMKKRQTHSYPLHTQKHTQHTTPMRAVTARFVTVQEAHFYYNTMLKSICTVVYYRPNI